MSERDTLLEVAEELADFLEEAHQPEMDASHHGDSRRAGPAPGPTLPRQRPWTWGRGIR